MPLMDHLGELRRRVMICLVCLVIAACILYLATPAVSEFLLDPIRPYVGEDASLIILNPLGGFTIRFKVAFFCAFIVTSPVWLWEFMAFLLPALKENERKWVVPTFAIGVVLYAVGMVFCYFIILPPAFEWMLAQSNDIGMIMPDAESYLKLIMLFEVGFGLAFELPLIVFYLIVFNIMPYKKLRASWRVVYIVLLILAACITPDASPVTMVLMFAALVLLYEASLLVSRIVLSKKIAKQALEDEEAAEEAAAKAGISMKSVKSGGVGFTAEVSEDEKREKAAKKAARKAARRDEDE